MAAGFLAYIMPVDQGAHPSHPISLPGDPGYGQIPGFTPGTPPPRPHPQPPLGTWGGGNVPFPTPPIYIPVLPPDGEGETPEHPIYIPVYPSNPIHLGPGGEIGGPPGTWGGAGQPFPTNPIVLPPGVPPGQAIEDIKKKLEFLLGNLPTNPNPTPEPV